MRNISCEKNFKGTGILTCVHFDAQTLSGLENKTTLLFEEEKEVVETKQIELELLTLAPDSKAGKSL